MDEINLSIILPTYNEEENLKILLPRLAKLFQKEVFEIVLVDDGSTDNTVLVAKEFCDKYAIKFNGVLREGKQGIGSAIRAGYDAGNGDILFSMDADCAFSDKDIINAWEKFNNEELDFLVGQRTGHSYESSSFRTWFKKNFSIAGNWLVSILVGLPGVNDYSLDFRIIKKHIWQSISNRPYHARNFFLFQMIDQASKITDRINQIPVQFLDRRRGVSKMNVLKDPFIFFYNFLVWKIKN
ncbi:MAG: glycosyltransferase family 2 protein [Patescibacteria group bacterium]|nr:glycosyltransferase family 2 protein [Patescibacteria group bacterium]|tara:strand:- start:9323 stop:10042 length:720 start_codon:yes stop_codon:yes gene_type:complete